jgi:hypothetical protein
MELHETTAENVSVRTRDGPAVPGEGSLLCQGQGCAGCCYGLERGFWIGCVTTAEFTRIVDTAPMLYY